MLGRRSLAGSGDDGRAVGRSESENFVPMPIELLDLKTDQSHQHTTLNQERESWARPTSGQRVDPRSCSS